MAASVSCPVGHLCQNKANSPRFFATKYKLFLVIHHSKTPYYISSKATETQMLIQCSKIKNHDIIGTDIINCTLHALSVTLINFTFFFCKKWLFYPF